MTADREIYFTVEVFMQLKKRNSFFYNPIDTILATMSAPVTGPSNRATRGNNCAR
jgi:hypothetical protein